MIKTWICSIYLSVVLLKNHFYDGDKTWLIGEMAIESVLNIYISNLLISFNAMVTNILICLNPLLENQLRLYCYRYESSNMVHHQCHSHRLSSDYMTRQVSPFENLEEHEVNPTTTTRSLTHTCTHIQANKQTNKQANGPWNRIILFFIVFHTKYLIHQRNMYIVLHQRLSI